MNENNPQLSRDPIAPQSQPPTLAELQQQVSKRRCTRKSRRRIAGSFLAAATVGLVVTFAYQTPQQVETETAATHIEPSITGTPTELRVAENPSSLNPEFSQEQNRFRVLARVHQPLPIFQRDENSDHLLHVGWMNSEQVVPVDVNQFQPEQQQSIQAVLTEETTAQFINL